MLADALFTSWKKGGQPGFCFRFGFSYQVCSYLKIFKNHSGLLADRTDAWLLLNEAHPLNQANPQEMRLNPTKVQNPYFLFGEIKEV